MNFLLSTAALILGPFIYAAGRRQPLARDVLDGFVLITVAGILCVHIVPDAIIRGGIPAMVMLGLGLLFPVAIERAFHHSMREAHVVIVVLAALALVVHAVVDGIALLPSGDPAAAAASVLGIDAGNELALGVILHRLPVGMAIWWSVRPHFGVFAAVATFALITVATGASYFLGGDVVAWAETRELAVFNAFVAGSLVHVVAFGISHEHDNESSAAPTGGSWAYRVGILLAMFLVFTVPQLH